MIEAGGPRPEIRPMRRADLDEVMEIERHSFPVPWPPETFLEELEREWARVEVLREREDGPIVAFVNYWVVRDEIHVLIVATHVEARRRGHASRLVEHVIDVARRERCRYITLEVRRSNEDALRLYRRHAFRPVGVRRRYYSDNDEDAIVMLLDLEAGK